MKTVSDLGEFNLLAQLHEILSPKHPDILVGLGDDAAVVKPPDAPIVMTTDAMVEGVHFKREWAPPQDIAHKALASALSDLAGKCANPSYALITLGLPGSTDLDWVLTAYQRFAELQNQWGISIIGGDTVRSPQIWISITVLGTQITEKPVQINCAQPGDWILASNTLGDAAAGLDSLLHPKKRERSQNACDFLRSRFHRPTPRLGEAKRLTELVTPSSMTDISDGLARDLCKVCQASGVGAKLDSKALPCSQALNEYAGADAAEFAWRGGEDYELLLTAPPDDAERLLSQWNDADCALHRIGELTSSPQIIVEGIDPDMKGFDHFK